MNALTVLGLLQQQMTEHPLENHGWSPHLWFWVILGIVLVGLFFALAFRRKDLPHDPGPKRSALEDPKVLQDREQIEHTHREVYP
jgi:hypothetical protein